MISTKLAKLKAMPPREIVHRVHYRAYTAIERWTLAPGSFSRPDRLRTHLAGDLAGRPDWQSALVRRGAAARFFAWEDNPDGLRELFHSQYRGELERGRAIATEVARHEIAFFGETFRFGDDISWHADPVSGAEWPRRYHRDVPVHGGNIGYGDVKYVWELNRHQFLVDLAKVAFLDRSQPHADELFGLLRSWHASVPHATGVPWACALEPAFRAWSWIWAYHLVRRAGLLPDDIHLEWLGGFHDHGRYLHRHLELYTSPYNHLIGEASALFALGVLFPEFRESGAWVRRGRRILESTVTNQFYSDGGSVEQSTFYHHATLGFYLLSAVLAARNGAPLSSAVTQAIERGIDFSAALTQPDGRVPSIGGADDGKPIRLEHLPFWDFRPYQAIGAVLFSRPDFKAVAGRFFEDALWMLGTAGLTTFARLERQAPATSRAFLSSGYYVARSGWSHDADYLCFDCGEQAAGLRRDHVPSAAHGHADCLSVIVTLGGRPVLVDPGFFCYNGDPAWEVHFRKTAAHNTVAIDGRDQARHVSKMAWTHTYLAQLDRWSPDANAAWAVGRHDGYANGPDGVMHRRTLWLRPEGYVILYDEIVGTGRHVAQAHFQFAPGTLALGASGEVLFDNRFELAWSCMAPCTLATAHGEPLPDGGWVTRSLGIREAAPRLTLQIPFTAPYCAWLTIVADRERVSVVGTPTDGPETCGEVLSMCIRGRHFEDWVLASGSRSVVVGGLNSEHPLAVLKYRDGHMVETSRIGGATALMPGIVPADALVATGQRA